MAKIWLSRSDARAMLELKDNEAVERLIQSKALDVAGYSKRGDPLFDLESVRRAARRLFLERESR